MSFTGPDDTIDGVGPVIRYPHTSRLVARAGAWNVSQIIPRGTTPGRCLGA